MILNSNIDSISYQNFSLLIKQSQDKTKVFKLKGCKSLLNQIQMSNFQKLMFKWMFNQGTLDFTIKN